MNRVKTSKFLSLILRHKPETIGITLDAQGWVSVADLLAAMERHGRPLSAEALFGLVRKDEKSRFTLSEHGTNIRAAQGHSVDVALDFPVKRPPDRLYHGTATRNLASIREEGLKPGQRQHVHLSASVKTARTVGQRYGVPHVLTIDTEQMWQEGHAFFQAENGVWLTDTVPPRFIAKEDKDD